MGNVTDASKNGVLEKCLSVLAKGYTTGFFDELFPLLAEDCVFETQWRMEPEAGKAAVIAYFTAKGRTLRDMACCPEADLIQFVGDANPIRNADMLFNGEPHHGTFVMMYEPNKLALRLRQRLNGQVNHVIVDLTLNEQDQIRRIDLCMPELFRYRVLQTMINK